MTLGIIVRDGTNTARTISEIVVRDGTNTQRTISEIWVRDTNNVPRLVFNPSGSASFTVAVSPAGATGFSFGTGTATTNSVEATPTGGTAPYTITWDLVSYTSLAGPPAADTPAASITTFTQTGIDPNTTVSAVWTATMTDTNALVATSDEFTTYFSDIT